MKKYLLSVCYAAEGTPPAPEALKKITRDVMALRDEMKAAGVWVFGGGLYPPTSATVLRQQNGQTLVTDGPFIESKEQIGGITIIKAPDLDAALVWASKSAAATTCAIEVRPFVEQPD